MIENSGFIEVNQLISEMYGLDGQRITNEIVKLQRIGMVVREQYNDFYGFIIDGLFITAKGIISVKNILPNRGRDTDYEDMLEETESYEQCIQGGNSYQEYFEREELESLLRKLPDCGSYRIDFVQYLLRNYLKPYHGDDAVRYNHPEIDKLDGITSKDFALLPGENCHFDILYRMALNFYDDEIEGTFLSYINDSEYEESKELGELGVELGRMEEPIINFARQKFKEISPMIASSVEELEDAWAEVSEELEYILEEVKPKKTPSEKELRFSQLCYYKTNQVYANEAEDVDFFIRENPRWDEESAKNNFNPVDWYTLDEVWQFVMANFHPAETEEERLFDEIISKIACLENIYDYYDFPKSWEDAGIGNYIRDLYNIQKK